MWFRLSEHNIIPGDELVGIFNPGAVEVVDKAGEKTGAVVVLKDGRTLASPFGLKVLTRRYNESKVVTFSLEKEKVTQRETIA